MRCLDCEIHKRNIDTLTAERDTLKAICAQQQRWMDLKTIQVPVGCDEAQHAAQEARISALTQERDDAVFKLALAQDEVKELNYRLKVLSDHWLKTESGQLIDDLSSALRKHGGDSCTICSLLHERVEQFRRKA